MSNGIDKNSLIQLTNKLYQLVLLFPKKEPLRCKMKESADDILADFISLLQKNPRDKNFTIVKNLENNLEILAGFFEVAKAQNWVSPSDMLATQKEYDNLREELEEFKKENLVQRLSQTQGAKAFENEAQEIIQEIPETQDVQNQGISPQVIERKEEGVAVYQTISRKGMSERQEKILAFLKENGNAQVWEVKQILPEVTKRTLRRDFDLLLRKGIIQRMGERNNTFYQLKTEEI